MTFYEFIIILVIKNIFVKNKLSWCLRVLVALADKKGDKNG
jgi:chorismate mutase